MQSKLIYDFAESFFLTYVKVAEQKIEMWKEKFHRHYSDIWHQNANEPTPLEDFIYLRISMNRIILFLFHKNKQNEVPEIKTGRLSATGKK